MEAATLSLIINLMIVPLLRVAEGAPLALGNGGPTSFFHVDGPNFPLLPSLSMTHHSHSFPFSAPVSITKSLPHHLAPAPSTNFFNIGHPMTGGKSNFLGTDDDFDAARHAARVGIELNRLERSSKDEYKDYIASGYRKNNFKIPQPYPLPLKHLSRVDTSLESFLHGDSFHHELDGLHFDDPDISSTVTLNRFSSLSPASFPTIFHGPNILGLQTMSSGRRGRVFALRPSDAFSPDIAVPSRGGPQQPEIVRSIPVFSSRSLHI